MHYIKIKNHIIDLKEICHAHPYFDRLVIVFKNGTNVEICFSGDFDKRDAELNYLWLALTNMKQ